MSLYEGAKKRARVDSELSEELEASGDAPMICAVTFSSCSGGRCCH